MAARPLSGPSLLCIYGEVGSGKSTLSASLATIAAERRERERRKANGLDPLGEEEGPIQGSMAAPTSGSALMNPMDDLPQVQLDAIHFCKQSDKRRTGK